MNKKESQIVRVLVGHIVEFLKMVAAAAVFAGMFDAGSLTTLIGGLVLLALALLASSISEFIE